MGIRASSTQGSRRPYGIAVLEDIEKDPSGLDLATARLPFSSMLLNLADEGLRLADHIFTYGYPLTEDLPHPVSGRSISLDPRYLEGYNTYTSMNDVPDYGPTPSYELDMPALQALSGAPVVKEGSGGQVAGVVYGTKDTGTVEEFSRVDEATGERIPELHRITTFAVAHYFDSLYNLRGRATDNVPLGEYLAT
jgi:hypothetical protein